MRLHISHPIRFVFIFHVQHTYIRSWISFVIPFLQPQICKRYLFRIVDNLKIGVAKDSLLAEITYTI